MKKIVLGKIDKRHILIALAVLFIIIVLMMMNIRRNDYKELTILFNNSFIELEKEPIIEKDSIIYFSKDDINNLFDKSIYYNEIDEELITTYNTHIAVLHKDDKNVTIDDEIVELEGALKEVEGDIYIPISEISDVYDIEFYYSVKSNRIIIDSILKKKTEVTVKQRTSLRNGKGLFSGKIETLIIGDKLVVLDNVSKYKKVRSPLGNIGYVKTSKVSEDKKMRDDYNEEKIELNPYFNYSNSAGIYDDFEVDKNKRNVVLPEFFIIVKNNKLLDKTNINSATFSVYNNWCSRNGLEMLPTLTSDIPISDSLTTYSQRTLIISELRNKAVEYGFWGININFKSIDDINSFYRFIIELSPRLRSQHIKVIVTINNNNIERSKIENLVDCIIEE